MSGLEKVLAAHVWWPGTPKDGPGCYCGWRCPAEKGVGRHDQHATHVAAAIRGYLLSEAVVEAAARVIANVECADWSMPEVDDDTWPVLRERNMRTARAALTAATEEDV